MVYTGEMGGGGGSGRIGRDTRDPRGAAGRDGLSFPDAAESRNLAGDRADLARRPDAGPPPRPVMRARPATGSAGIHGS